MIECVLCCDTGGPFAEVPGFGYVCEPCVDKFNLLCYSGFESKDEIKSKIIWNRNAYKVISSMQDKHI